MLKAIKKYTKVHLVTDIFSQSMFCVIFEIEEYHRRQKRRLICQKKL